MNISPFFRELNTAYQAELDDLHTDSEGRDVLKKRLAEKRRELGFLVKMIELSPEMVAVVLRQAFRFTHAGTLEQLLSRDADDLPPWEEVHAALELAPWALPVAQTILQEPQGAWFMTLAAGLEYLQHKPHALSGRAADAADEDDEDVDAVREQRHDDSHTEDHDEDEAAQQAREDAGNDWLAEQGFDRKE